jgi:5-formyltetrahydrofolate cyclo-ligase
VSDTISQQKKLLRQEFRTRRAGLSSDWIQKASHALWLQLQALPVFQKAQQLAVFAGMPGEPVLPLKPGWVMPRVEGNQLLLHRLMQLPTKRGAFNILEPDHSWPVIAPEDVELFLVPGLVFDRAGGRLGMGKGFYDRLLLSSRGYRLGVCWSFQLIQNVPIEAHDIRMQAICTEAGVFYVH